MVSSREPLPHSAISGTPAPPGTEKPLSADDITLQKCKRVVAEQNSGKGREGRAQGAPGGSVASSTCGRLRTAQDKPPHFSALQREPKATGLFRVTSQRARAAGAHGEALQAQGVRGWGLEGGGGHSAQLSHTETTGATKEPEDRVSIQRAGPMSQPPTQGFSWSGVWRSILNPQRPGACCNGCVRMIPAPASLGLCAPGRRGPGE